MFFCEATLGRILSRQRSREQMSDARPSELGIAVIERKRKRCAEGAQRGPFHRPAFNRIIAGIVSLHHFMIHDIQVLQKSTRAPEAPENFSGGDGYYRAFRLGTQGSR